MSPGGWCGGRVIRWRAAAMPAVAAWPAPPCRQAKSKPKCYVCWHSTTTTPRGVAARLNPYEEVTVVVVLPSRAQGVRENGQKHPPYLALSLPSETLAERGLSATASLSADAGANRSTGGLFPTNVENSSHRTD